MDRLGNGFVLWIENYIALVVQHRRFVAGRGWHPIAQVAEPAGEMADSAGLSAGVDGFGRVTATWAAPALLKHEGADVVSPPALSVAYGGRALAAWSYGQEAITGVIWGASLE